jgi:CoA:oxalate CoA-transferase
MIWNVEEAADSSHARHRQLMTTVTHSSLGSLRLPEQPVHFSDLERGDIRPSPALGGDGAAILEELLEISADEIAALQAAEVI